MTTSKMSFNNSSSHVERDLLREQQRKARRAQVVDSKDAPPNPKHLFTEPIKVVTSSDDPLGKQIKRTLGEYDVMRVSISTDPKKLIGLDHETPPYHNGQHNRGRPSSSKGDGRSNPPKSSHPPANVDFSKPKVSTKSSSSSSLSHSTSAYPAFSNPVAVEGHAKKEPVAALLPTPSFPPLATPQVPPSRQQHQQLPPSSPAKEKARDRGPPVQASPLAKYLPNATMEPRPPNGVILNGNVKGGGYPRSSSGVKPNLKLKVDNQEKSTKELESIMKEMIIAPTPLTAIPTPRKDETKFPFPSVGNNQLEGSAAPATSVGKLAVVRPLNSSLTQRHDKSGPTTKPGDVLDGDLEISEDSEDEANPGIQKKSTTPKSVRSPGRAVLTSPPSPLGAMSQGSESSSSGSSSSSSEDESDDNSNKSPTPSKTSDAGSRPESPKSDADWNLDRFIQNPPALPLGLPPESIPNVDKVPQSFDIRYFPSEEDLCSVPGLIEGFSNDDISNRMPSPAPHPLESIIDPHQEDEMFSKAIEDVQPMSLSPIPSMPFNKKKSLATPPRPSTPSMLPPSLVAPTSNTKVNSEAKAKGKEINKKELDKNGFSKTVFDNVHQIAKVEESLLPKSDKCMESNIANHKGHKGPKGREPSLLMSTSHKPNQSDLEPTLKKSVIERKPCREKKAYSKKAAKAPSEASTARSTAENASKRSPEMPKRMQSPAVVQPSPKPSSRQDGSASGGKKDNRASNPSKSEFSQLIKSPVSAPLSMSCKPAEKGLSGNVHPKKVSSSAQKIPKAQRSKIKSREHISDSNESDSENEIDVVGTPSTLKLANGAKGLKKQSPSLAASVESITETINAVSTGVGVVRKTCHLSSPDHRTLARKTHSSKDSGSQKTKKSSLGVSVGSSDDLSAKTVLLSPINREDFESRSTSLHIPPLEYRDGKPSLMVRLNLSWLDRVPRAPPSEPCGVKEADGKSDPKNPSKLGQPKKAGNSENKRPLPPSAIEGATTPKCKPKILPEETGKASKELTKKMTIPVKKESQKSITPDRKTAKRAFSEVDTNKSEKKKLKLSKEFVSSSSLSSSSSSLCKKEVSQAKPAEAKAKKERKDKESSSTSSSSAKVVRSEPKTESGIVSKSLKSKGESLSVDKKRSTSSSSVKSEKKSKMPKDSSERLKAPKEKDAQLLLVKAESKNEVEAERCRLVDKEGRSPTCSGGASAVIKGNCTPNDVTKSIESVEGLSQNLGDSVRRSKYLKHRSKEQGSGREQDVKRRKQDSVPSSQTTSSMEGPKTGTDCIERNTNHDRIPPISTIANESKLAGSHSNDWASYLEKINSEIEPRPHHNQIYYLAQAKHLKHEADKEVDKTTQALRYLHAVLYFVLSGIAMEREHSNESMIFRMYKNTADLSKFVSSKFRVQQCVPLNGMGDRKLAVLSLWCQSILYLKMFNMRKNDMHDNLRTLTDYQINQRSSAAQAASSSQRTASPHQPSPSNSSVAPPSLWNAKTTGAPSPLSPLPSPAGSVGSVESVSSGYSSSEINSQNKVCHTTFNSATAALTNPVPVPLQAHMPHPVFTITLPVHIHSTMQKQLDNLYYVSSAHELWDQAEALITEGCIQDFFTRLDEICGRLTLRSSLDELVKYVMLGLNCINLKT